MFKTVSSLTVQDRVIGILDWELSTVGNQMCDVAYMCLVCWEFLFFSICMITIRFQHYNF